MEKAKIILISMICLLPLMGCKVEVPVEGLVKEPVYDVPTKEEIKAQIDVEEKSDVIEQIMGKTLWRGKIDRINNVPIEIEFKVTEKTQNKGYISINNKDNNIYKYAVSKENWFCFVNTAANKTDDVFAIRYNGEKRGGIAFSIPSNLINQNNTDIKLIEVVLRDAEHEIEYVLGNDKWECKSFVDKTFIESLVMEGYLAEIKKGDYLMEISSIQITDAVSNKLKIGYGYKGVLMGVKYPDDAGAIPEGTEEIAGIFPPMGENIDQGYLVNDSKELRSDGFDSWDYIKFTSKNDQEVYFDVYDLENSKLSMIFTKVE